MEIQNELFGRQAIDDILTRDEDPVTKVQQIVNLGFEEEVANGIVERYQVGQNAPVYYEQLPLDQF